jgi:hypothetical protein
VIAIYFALQIVCSDAFMHMVYSKSLFTLFWPHLKYVNFHFRASYKKTIEGLELDVKRLQSQLSSEKHMRYLYNYVQLLLLECYALSNSLLLES